MNQHNPLVYGEAVDDLLPPLLRFVDASRVTSDGSWESSVKMDLAEAAPLRRALLRAEAQLMMEDADAIGTAAEDDRTHDQRGADALMLIAAAMEASATHSGGRG